VQTADTIRPAEDYSYSMNEEDLAASEREAEARLLNATQEMAEATRQLDKVKDLKRRAAHLAFYEKYGDWDWNVRQKWIDFVKSFDVPFDRYKNGGLGHPFELWNYQPRAKSPETPAELPAWPANYFQLSRLTNAWVSPADFEKCRPDAKTIEAFQLQADYHMEQKDRLLGYVRGFMFNSKAVDWNLFDGNYDTGLGEGFLYRL
jgi:hypothetical protein